MSSGENRAKNAKSPIAGFLSSRWGLYADKLLGRTVIFFVEAFNAAGRVDHFLFASEKGMASRADFDVVVAERGARFNDVTAGTCNFGGFIIRMNTVLHLEPLYKNRRFRYRHEAIGTTRTKNCARLKAARVYDVLQNRSTFL